MAKLWGTEVSLSFIIAFTQRCGSHLLCDTIQSCKIAGYPLHEPFSNVNVNMFCKKWGLEETPTLEKYIAAVVKNSTTPNGVFGVKIHWDQIEDLRETLGVGERMDRKIIEYLFPDAKFIYMTRDDIRGQAISAYRAEVTRNWWLIDDVYNWQVARPDPPYDSDAIRFFEDSIRLQERRWHQYFKSRKIDPLHIEYSKVAEDPHREASRCLEYLGLDASALDPNFKTQFRKQADAVSRAWHRRLDEEDALEAQKKDE